MGAILLPIRPVYADMILDGSKRFEFRRQAVGDVGELVLYATKPTGMVVGAVKVLEVLSATKPHLLWALTLEDVAPVPALLGNEATAYGTPNPGAGITSRDFDSYFKGAKTCFAYRLGAARRFDPPRELARYGLIRPPQNFVRLTGPA